MNKIWTPGVRTVSGSFLSIQHTLNPALLHVRTPFHARTALPPPSLFLCPTSLEDPPVFPASPATDMTTIAPHAPSTLQWRTQDPHMRSPPITLHRSENSTPFFLYRTPVFAPRKYVATSSLTLRPSTTSFNSSSTATSCFDDFSTSTTTSNARYVRVQSPRVGEVSTHAVSGPSTVQYILPSAANSSSHRKGSLPSIFPPPTSPNWLTESPKSLVLPEQIPTRPTLKYLQPLATPIHDFQSSTAATEEEDEHSIANVAERRGSISGANAWGDEAPPSAAAEPASDCAASVAGLVPHIMVKIPTADLDLDVGLELDLCNGDAMTLHNVEEDKYDEATAESHGSLDLGDSYGAWGTFEKGKWKEIAVDLNTDDEDEDNVPTPTQPQTRMVFEDDLAYDSACTSEFLVGCSTSCEAYPATGYSSLPRNAVPAPRTSPSTSPRRRKRRPAPLTLANSAQIEVDYDHDAAASDAAAAAVREMDARLATALMFGAPTPRRRPQTAPTRAVLPPSPRSAPPVPARHSADPPAPAAPLAWPRHSEPVGADGRQGGTGSGASTGSSMLSAAWARSSVSSTGSGSDESSTDLPQTSGRQRLRSLKRLFKRSK
ncbi:uncharacterized protein BXZ73DRAFT_98658 [Epithele typhae]|uniref:uncharacterized protein n=1 Tax=Epithele typhae TaxID=378194 RepID=UPI0020071FCA|nr:uncharacterized protein BXZ73DRAFT_98658 [Epithele typhae]KAH9940828.1 hypothetical protein BXZ73DRAFT_98658 [Epithele typhae]